MAETGLAETGLRDDSPSAVLAPPGSPLSILFVAWRDLANPMAGGSELLVDRLASGLAARGHRPSLLCGGPTAPRLYPIARSGGTYTQYLKAPLAYRRRFRASDLVVEVCNGMPFLAPLWCRRPVLCLVNHVHTDMWRGRFPAPLAAAGRRIESDVMPAVHRRSLFMTVSQSTRAALVELGVDEERIRLVHNGVAVPEEIHSSSPTPLFVTVSRLERYKRIDLLLRLWERVRPVTGGRLVIVGEGPERQRLEAAAGPDVTFAGRVGEDDKHRLMCEAWLLLHPSAVEGWGLVVLEAAARHTPAVGFDVPGVRDAIQAGHTGILASTEEEMVSAWLRLASDVGAREIMAAAAAKRAYGFTWSATVDRFLEVAAEAISEHSAPAS